METTAEFLLSLGVVICADGRRRWPEEVKARIVAETLEPGVTVNSVAARYAVRANHISGWHRLAKDGKPVLSAAEPSDEPTAFDPLVMCEPEPPLAILSSFLRARPSTYPRSQRHSATLLLRFCVSGML